MPDFAVLDHGRAACTRMPEVVFCQGKTPAEVVAIVGRLLTNEGLARPRAPRSKPPRRF